MVDIPTSQWSETAANNNASPPNGFPEGQTAASLNNSAREMMAAIKREWNRDHPTITAGGTADALTLTYTTAPTAYVDGMRFQFYAAADNATDAPTLDVNGLGAKTIIERNATSLAPTRLRADAPCTVVYRASDDSFVLPESGVVATGPAIYYEDLHREEMGTSATVNGVKTISFAVSFSSIINVQITPRGGSGAGVISPLFVSTPSATGMVVYGAVTESFAFYWRVFGQG